MGSWPSMARKNISSSEASACRSGNTEPQLVDGPIESLMADVEDHYVRTDAFNQGQQVRADYDRCPQFGPSCNRLHQHANTAWIEARHGLVKQHGLRIVQVAQQMANFCRMPRDRSAAGVCRLNSRSNSLSSDAILSADRSVP